MPDNNDKDDKKSQYPSNAMQKRFVQFQQTTIFVSEEDSTVAEEEGHDDDVVEDETKGAASNSTLVLDEVIKTDLHAPKLMIDFQDILDVTSGEDIFCKVLPTASCFEGKENFQVK